MQQIRKPELYNKVNPDTVKRQRYDLYVDESGQNTKGELFVVAVVATENSDEFRQYCESLEQSSGKGKVKWRSAHKMRRLDYLCSIMLHSLLTSLNCFIVSFAEQLITIQRRLMVLQARFASCDLSDLMYMFTLMVFLNLNATFTKLGCDNLVVLLKR